jgi:hypothetical protein
MDFIRQFIQEETMTDLRKMPKTRYDDPNHLAGHYNEQDIDFDPDKGILTVGIRTAKDVAGNYKNRPNYTPRTVTKSGNTKNNNVKGYSCTVQFWGWDRIVDEFVDNSEGDETQDAWNLIDYTMKNADVLLHCNCPSYHWNGHKQLEQEFAVAKDNNRYSNNPMVPPRYVVDPKTGKKKNVNKTSKVQHTKDRSGAIPVCKHLWEVVKGATEYTRNYGSIKYVMGQELASWLRNKHGISSSYSTKKGEKYSPKGR